MEKIMSKTTRSSESRDVHENRELRDDEIALASGGTKGASAGPKISESLSLPYEQIKFEYTQQRS
jgi:hypothetical protein